MKNYKIYLSLFLVLLVIGFAFLGSKYQSFNILKEFSYDEYKEEVKSGNLIVYLGKAVDDDYNYLKEFATKNKMDSVFLDIDKLTQDQVKSFYDASVTDYKNKLLFYENGDLLYQIEGPYSDSYLQGVFMNFGFIDRSYIELNLKEYIDLIKADGVRFMFIGSTSCGYCDMFKETINSFYQEGYLAEIYYLDISKLTQDEFNELKETDSYFESEEWGTPLNFVYENGERKAVLSGYNELDNFIEFMNENGVILNDESSVK